MSIKVLLFDTCGADASIALAEVGPRAGDSVGWAVVAEAAVPGRRSSERLLPELRTMLAGAEWRLDDLGAICVASGPGSFTGLRVGVAAAKGLCEGSGVPLVMVSRLLVLAHKAGLLVGEAGRRNGEVPGKPGIGSMAVGHALLDAGRDEFFYGGFQSGAAPVEMLLGREAAAAEVRRGGLPGRVAVCEEVVRLAVEELGPVTTAPLTAADLLPLVKARIDVGAFDDVATSDANYVRRTDLEMLARLAQRSAGA